MANPGVPADSATPIEIDSESGAEIYVLGGDERPADNIYGEQPYGDATRPPHCHPLLSAAEQARRHQHPGSAGRLESRDPVRQAALPGVPCLG